MLSTAIRAPKSKANAAVVVVALAMALYHMAYTQVLLQGTVQHNNTHLGFALVLVYLTVFATSRGKGWRVFSAVLALLSLLATGYIQIFCEELQLRAWFSTNTDLIVGAILILLVLEAARQSFGWIIPLFAILVVIYPFIGSVLPEPFHTTSYGLSKTISNLSVSLNNGIYGPVLPASANFIFLFMVFGGLLQATGATKFFVELGKLAGRRLRGGPGLMAVVSSATVGSITGNVTANIAITGPFTISLMKKIGYTPEQAGAIEAAASNGGQIMPPVMGIVAFGMAAITGIPYLQIITMALIPAILYFSCVGLYVQLRAQKLRLETVEEEIDIKVMLSSAPLFLVPLAVIIALLIMGYTVWYVAFWAIISIIVVSVGRKETRYSLATYIEGFAQGAKAGAQIAAMAGCIGLILATLTMSGLGVKLSSGIEAWSGGYLLPALMIVAAICVFMGLGGASLTAYIIASIFAVPALTKMGVGFEQAHFFTMFVAVFAFLTPPVAIAALIAARIAGASYIRTTVEAVKVAIAGFLLPFMFIYCPILLLQPQETLQAITRVAASLVALLTFQIAFVGYYIRECRPLERVLALVASASLIAFLPLQSYVLLGVGIAVFTLVTLWQLRRRRYLRAIPH
ncbi:TRAP transporter permease [Chloroflexota bacterium]